MCMRWGEEERKKKRRKEERTRVGQVHRVDHVVALVVDGDAAVELEVGELERAAVLRRLVCTAGLHPRHEQSTALCTRIAVANKHIEKRKRREEKRRESLLESRVPNAICERLILSLV